jgi:isopentenyl-diphosphate delta-isomerase
MIEADALTLHLNPLQEAIQPEGQTRFTGLLAKIADVARALDVPVVAKEVGSGLSRSVGERLAEAGVRILDTAGTGGTSWARIEGARANDAEIGERFAGWGIETAESILGLRGLRDVTLIASGGIRDGIDVAKSIALGADLAGLAYPFLKAATDSSDAVEVLGRRVVRELRICMFCLGVRTVGELKQVPVRRIGEGVLR